MSFFAPDAVWDMSAMGLGVFKGAAAIRGFIEDWIGAYEEYEVGRGGSTSAMASCSRDCAEGRPVGSSRQVQMRFGTVNVWDEGLIVRVTNYPDIDEARAAAERLAEERG